jgi:hypothetical protein
LLDIAAESDLSDGVVQGDLANRRLSFPTAGHLIAEVIPRSYDSVGKLVSQPQQEAAPVFQTDISDGIVCYPTVIDKMQGFGGSPSFFWLSVTTYRTKHSSANEITGCHLKSLNIERRVIVTTLRFGLGVNFWRWDMPLALSLVIPGATAVATHG